METKISESVVILAAGLGTRMAPYSHVPKHLLPYEGKALISHTIEAFPRSATFWIVVNENDVLTKDYVLSAHPDLDIRVVKSVNAQHRGNPLYDLRQGLGYCPKHSRIFFSVADNVFELPKFTHQKNWLGSYRVPRSIQHQYENLAASPDGRFRMATHKRELEGALAWTGVGYFETQNTLINMITLCIDLHNDGDGAGDTFADLFTYLAKVLSLHVIEHPSWLDLGTADKYKESLPHYDWSRDDQITYDTGPRLVKYFDEIVHAQAFQDRWFSFSLKNRLPYVEQRGNYVSYEKIEGNSAYQGMTLKGFNDFLGIMATEFWTLPDNHQPPIGVDELKSWPVTKARERLAHYLGNVQAKEYKTINGRQIRTNFHGGYHVVVEELVRANFHLARIHGDLTLDNLVVSESGLINMVDWRPTAFDPQGLAVGDLYYDMGKLFLSTLINLREFKAGRFTLIEEGDGCTIGLPTDERLAILQTHLMVFADAMDLDFDVIRYHAVLQLLSMAGLHKEPFATACYVYGTYLLDKLASGVPNF